MTVTQQNTDAPACDVPDTLPTADVVALLTAIRDALIVPFPADGFERQSGWLMTDRASTIRAVIANIEGGLIDGEAVTARWWADCLRGQVENLSPTYPEHVRKQATQPVAAVAS